MSMLDGIPEFEIPKGDRLPPLEVDAELCGGGVFDFTGWSMAIEMVGPVTITGACTLSGGLITYDWDGGDTDVPGDYEVRFRGTSPSGKPQTFGPLLVRVLP